MNIEPFEVYAIRYATVARRSSENFIGGDPHESGARMDYFVWLVRNGAHSFVVDVAAMVDGWRKLEALASAPQHVVPGHDPLVMHRYRAPDPSMEGTVVRLDAEPVEST